MPSPLLGPRVRTYGTRVSPLAVLWHLGIGPAVIVAALVTRAVVDSDAVLVGVLVGVLVLIVSAAFLAWSASAYLSQHHHGLVVGRRILGGAPRELLFTEIHPASIRVFTGIDDVRPLRGGQRVIRPRWHFAPGADLAVTFVGPEPSAVPSAPPRPPLPGRGLVVFGSQEAAGIAEELRRGLERAGCPPPLSRWSQRFPAGPLPGTGARAESAIPGADPRWTP